MPAAATQPEPITAPAAASFAHGDRVRLTAAALDRMCPAAREAFDKVVAEFRRHAPKNPNLVDVDFGGFIGTERWHVSLIEHAADATPAAANGGANP